MRVGYCFVLCALLKGGISVSTRLMSSIKTRKKRDSSRVTCNPRNHHDVGKHTTFFLFFRNCADAVSLAVEAAAAYGYCFVAFSALS